MISVADYIADRIDVGVFSLDRALTVGGWNRFMATHSGVSAEAVSGRPLLEVFPELPADWLQRKVNSVFLLKNFAFSSWEQRPYLFRFAHNRPLTGGIDAMRQNVTFLPMKNDAGAVEAVCVTVFDVTDLAMAHVRLSAAMHEVERQHAEQKRLYRELEDAHCQLLQSEKLASIGQLAAGVAHEINNPIGFVNSNLGTLQRYIADLIALVDTHERLGAALPAPAQAEIAATRQRIDYDYLREDVESLVQESRDGLGRVKKIVQDLKDFSRIDSSEWQFADLHACLDSTLNVAANELKYKADIDRQYGTLPEVECLPSQLNQVFMNLLVNAAQSIVERGTITVRTGVVGDEAHIVIADTGCGMPEAVVQRIFDPFFTTKPVGKGTGLGLSVSYSIVQKHHGRIDVRSTVGVGTEFEVSLPLHQPPTAHAS